MYHLRFEEFLRSVDCPKFDELFKNLRDYQILVSSQQFKGIDSTGKIRKGAVRMWNSLKKATVIFSFQYWSVFLDKIVPVLRDLTLSFRESEWMLHLSSTQRALSLFFAFDRTNYSHWTPLYFDDCIKLK